MNKKKKTGTMAEEYAELAVVPTPEGADLTWTDEDGTITVIIPDCVPGDDEHRAVEMTRDIIVRILREYAAQMGENVRTFSHFPKEAVCPVCRTNRDEKSILIEIQGTARGHIAEAQPFHADCFDPKKALYSPDYHVVYIRT